MEDSPICVSISFHRSNLRFSWSTTIWLIASKLPPRSAHTWISRTLDESTVIFLVPLWRHYHSLLTTKYKYNTLKQITVLLKFFEFKTETTRRKHYNDYWPYPYPYSRPSRMRSSYHRRCHSDLTASLSLARRYHSALGFLFGRARHYHISKNRSRTVNGFKTTKDLP